MLFSCSLKRILQKDILWMASPSSRTCYCSVTLLLVLLSLASSAVSRDMQKRSFASLGCMGVYDKAKFARLDRVCEECFQMYREPEVHALCRNNCFKNDYFWTCVDALLLKHEENNLNGMVSELYGKRK